MIHEAMRVMWCAQAAARMVDDQALIVLTQRGEVLVLNASGTWLWNQLGEACSVRELAARLAVRFHLAEARALADVQQFVGELLRIDAIVGV